MILQMVNFFPLELVSYMIAHPVSNYFRWFLHLLSKEYLYITISNAVAKSKIQVYILK